ncbi:MAG: RND transporter, partial [Pseudomonadota bacterium]|nr:RND transporter [Pseudomonadota bacterium]
MTVARIALPACAMLLAGCATTAVEMPDAAIAAPVTYAADLPAAGLDEAWWQAFSDPVLDTLIARGLSAKLETRAASDRVLAAAALLRAEQGDRLPTIDG